ncbi:hypothetical protein HER17_04970 [Pectobacterium carotovorum]|nr:hypothetical protein HER17_04970 [Pectobacterium carotovorum]
MRVSLPDGARWRYRYDAFGRRINKVREGHSRQHRRSRGWRTAGMATSLSVSSNTMQMVVRHGKYSGCMSRVASGRWHRWRRRATARNCTTSSPT